MVAERNRGEQALGCGEEAEEEPPPQPSPHVPSRVREAAWLGWRVPVDTDRHWGEGAEGTIRGGGGNAAVSVIMNSGTGTVPFCSKGSRKIGIVP